MGLSTHIALNAFENIKLTTQIFYFNITISKCVGFYVLFIITLTQVCSFIIRNSKDERKQYCIEILDIYVSIIEMKMKVI